MRPASSRRARRHGITVLGLLLLIIGLMVGGFFLLRYLRSRQAANHSPPLVRPATSLLLHQPLDQLDLTGVVKVVRGDPVDLLGAGPDPARGEGGQAGRAEPSDDLT